MYFITVCTAARRQTLGAVLDGAVQLTPLGVAVEHEWLNTAVIRPEIRLDLHVVMPNHMHALLYIPVDAPGSLSRVVGGFKGAATRRAREAGIENEVWQRNYYERIVRTQRQLEQLRLYIRKNPERWARDRLNR